MSDIHEKATNMRRVVIYYKESGHIYLEGLLLEDTLMAAFYDSDFPSYIQFTRTVAGDSVLSKLIEYLQDRPEWAGLEMKILDNDTKHYDPRSRKFYNENWQEVEPAYKEVE